MILLQEKSNCCGCEACVQVCPKHCIDFLQDNEGFFYPKVNVEACINCGLCDKVCPILNVYEEHKPQEVLAAVNKNDIVRSESSSGGIFTVLSSDIISSGGAVFGVRFNERWQAVFDYADTIDKVAAFRGSKYLQARIGNSFTQCKTLLDTGRMVLFSGTPCQIAALNHFLRKPYSNLLTVDFICHGVPSPKVWNQYLEEVIDAGKNAISDVKFRNKKNGLASFGLSLGYDKKNKILSLCSPITKNAFMKAFLTNLILRPSCHFCPAKNGRSHSDITIADFWGIDKIAPEIDDDKGTSLVMIHTEKGAKLWERNDFKWVKTRYEDVLIYNPCVAKSAKPHFNREKFFCGFSNEVNLHKLISDCLRPTIKQRLNRIIRLPFSVVNKLLLHQPNVSVKNENTSDLACHNLSKMKIGDVNFRNKLHGWKRYQLVIKFYNFPS